MYAVAPLAGAWIETVSCIPMPWRASVSRPSRARGLKPYEAWTQRARSFVAPLAGAWIETSQGGAPVTWPTSRAPRGRVD